MNNLWNRIQMVKVHYQMGALPKSDFIEMLDLYFLEATALREARS